MCDLRVWLKTGIEILACYSILQDNGGEHLIIRFRVSSTGREYRADGRQAERVLLGIRNAWDRVNSCQDGQDPALEPLRRVSEPLERGEA